MIISVDYDGTIVNHSFPEVGEPKENAFETLRDLKAAGHILILNTCREDCNKRKYLTEAVEFCRENGVEFDGVNETPLDYEFRQDDGLRRKVFASVYIDDRNLEGFSGWNRVRELIL